MLKIKHEDHAMVWSLYTKADPVEGRPHCWGVTYAPSTAGHGSGPAWLNGCDVARYDGYAWSWTRRMFLIIDVKMAVNAGPGDWLAGIAVVLEPGGEWVRQCAPGRWTSNALPQRRPRK